MNDELDPQRLDADGEEVGDPAADAEAAAGALFVHGATSHLLGDGATIVARRVDAALAIIDGERVPLARRRRWAAGLAAALLAGLLVWSLLPGGRAPLLLATVQAARAAAEAPVDRQYRLQLTFGSERRIDGTMTVRGHDHFVVAVEMPPGPFVLGCDGSVSWAVPALPALPVRTSPGIGRPRETLAGEGVPLPFHSLATFLQRIERDFELSAVAAGELVRLSGGPRRPDGDERFTVAIDVDAASGVVRQLQIEWPFDRLQRVPQSVRLQWLGDPALGSDFYGHAAHHAADRPVVEFR